MSGSIEPTNPMAEIPFCSAGTHPQYDKTTKTWRCVPDANSKPFALIWQGDCDGFLAVRLSFVPAVNPAIPQSGPQMARRRQPMTGSNVEIQLQGLPRTVRGLATLRTRLEKQLKGFMAPGKASARRKAAKAAGAKAKARPRTKAARRKK